MLGVAQPVPPRSPKPRSKPKPQAKFVRHKPASRMLTARARIPLPDRTLLQRQPEPDCTFRGTISSPMTVEELRQKLDYEQQCYRQSRVQRARAPAQPAGCGRRTRSRRSKSSEALLN